MSNIPKPIQLNLIAEYERNLTEKDKKAMRKEISLAESLIPRNRKKVFLKFQVLAVFSLIIFIYPETWLIITLAIISFFIIWLLIIQLRDLINKPKFLSVKRSVIDTGIVKVKEFKIDRYIKIRSYGDEGDHFILEYEGQLTMVGGQDFDGIRKLKNKIEYIDIMDSGKKGYYHTRIDKSGDTLEPLFEQKGKLSKELTKSELWKKLTEQVPFAGKLEDLLPYINGQPRKIVENKR